MILLTIPYIPPHFQLIPYTFEETISIQVGFPHHLQTNTLISLVLTLIGFK